MLLYIDELLPWTVAVQVVGQGVSLTDRRLEHRVAAIVRANQQRVTVDCDGYGWHVSFALLRATWSTPDHSVLGNGLRRTMTVDASAQAGRELEAAGPAADDTVGPNRLGVGYQSCEGIALTQMS